MAYKSNPQRRAAVDAFHATAGLLSPDERLMAAFMFAAEIIDACYSEEAHELLAEMARHDVFEFLLALSIEHDQERNSSQRRAV